MELGADIIAVYGGATDSGPHYLGTGMSKTGRAAVSRDLEAIMSAAHAARIPWSLALVRHRGRMPESTGYMTSPGKSLTSTGDPGIAR